MFSCAIKGAVTSINVNTNAEILTHLIMSSVSIGKKVGLHRIGLSQYQWGWTAIPMNSPVKNTNMYACRKATNNSNMLNATEPSRLAGTTPKKANVPAEALMNANQDGQHHVPRHHVG